MKAPRKTLGILGGMGPAAGAEFLRLLTALSPVKEDQDHVPAILLSDPRVPDRTAAILGRGEDPSAVLLENLLKLASWGADLLAVPCNTAHVFIDRFAGQLPVPLVHIVEETLREARERNPSGGWLLATEGTVKSGLYPQRAERKGFRLLLPAAGEQIGIDGIIRLVKAGRLEESGMKLGALCRELWEKEEAPILAACTEIPLAYKAARLPEAGMVSSLEALAGGALRELGMKPCSPCYRITS